MHTLALPLTLQSGGFVTGAACPDGFSRSNGPASMLTAAPAPNPGDCFLEPHGLLLPSLLKCIILSTKFAALSRYFCLFLSFYKRILQYVIWECSPLRGVSEVPPCSLRLSHFDYCVFSTPGVWTHSLSQLLWRLSCLQFSPIQTSYNEHCY